MNKQKRHIELFILIIVALFAAIFLPPALSKPSQGITTAVAIGMGVDKGEGKYTVSLQIVTPDSSGQNKENISVVDGDGESIIDALQKLGYKLGKGIGFEHCGAIVLGEGLKDENIITLLDYFYRHQKVQLSTALISYQGEAKELLSETNEVNTTSSGSIQNNLHYNKDFLGTGKTSTIGTFLEGYYKKGSTCTIVEIEKVEKEKEEGAGGGSEEGGGGAKPNKFDHIKNNGGSAVYKDGRFVASVDEQINRGFNRLNNQVEKGIDEIDGLHGEPFDNAKIAISIEDTKIKFEHFSIDGKFLTKANVKIYCRPVSVMQESGNKKLESNLKSYLTSEVKQRLSDKVKEEVAASLAFCKANNVDCFGLEDGFYRHLPKIHKQALSKISSERFLQDCEIDVDVKVYPYK